MESMELEVACTFSLIVFCLYERQIEGENSLKYHNLVRHMKLESRGALYLIHLRGAEKATMGSGTPT